MANIPVVFHAISGREVERDFSGNNPPPENYTRNEHYVLKEVDEAIGDWRTSYDAEKDVVVVAYPKMTDEEAIAQYEVDIAALNKISTATKE